MTMFASRGEQPAQRRGCHEPLDIVPHVRQPLTREVAVKKYSIPWITETVEQAMLVLDDALAMEIAGLLSEVSDDQNKLVLVFDVHGECAFQRFPVDVTTYDRQFHEMDSPIHCRHLLAGRTFLDPRDDYPLGRHDLAGVNFLEDLLVVQHAVTKHFLNAWARVRATLPGYIGVVEVDDRTHQPLPSELVNLNTGQIETLTLEWSP
jgi:hypothetical protein